jgi:hypothetical protein
MHGDELAVLDRLDGKGRRLVETSLPLAPGASLAANPIGTGSATVERRWVSERFFERAEADALVVREERSLPVELGWRIAVD